MNPTKFLPLDFVKDNVLARRLEFKVLSARKGFFLSCETSINVNFYDHFALEFLHYEVCE